jgi:alpha-galactosidase
LDDFTKNLLTNDEVLAVDQDALGKQASRVSQEGTTEVWAKPLSDGTWAAGLFNLGEQKAPVTVHFDALNISGKQNVRDLWRQMDFGQADSSFTTMVQPHGVILVKIGTSVSDR